MAKVRYYDGIFPMEGMGSVLFVKVNGREFEGGIFGSGGCIFRSWIYVVIKLQGGYAEVEFTDKEVQDEAPLIGGIPRVMKGKEQDLLLKAVQVFLQDQQNEK